MNDHDFLDDLKPCFPPEPADAWNTDAAWQRLAARMKQPRAWRPPMWTAAAVIAAIGIGVIWQMNERGIGRLGAQRYATATGERRVITLADGTDVELAPQTHLIVPRSYNGRTRKVQLEGEAYFNVKHDSARPFSVQAGNALLRDLGTSFDVSAYRGAAVDVVVVEGRVQVEAARGHGQLVLTAGQAARVDRFARVTMRSAHVADATSWRTGQLSFTDARFADVATELERWYGVQIAITSPALAETHVTAIFAGQSLEEMTQLLAETVNARVARNGNSITYAPR